jgi:MobA/MobL family protein
MGQSLGKEFDREIAPALRNSRRMAIYHLTAKIVSRARGQSAVAAAAYRSGRALSDKRYGLIQDYTHKEGVEHSEILAPDDAPAWVHDRERLWNEVEAFEKRKDAQLARELEIALPVELTRREQEALARDYVRNFIAKGMIADLNIHRDNPENPHLHVLLTMRRISPEGFGPKERAWNAKERLLEWRANWAELANAHLARAGHAIYIDHRTLEAQEIELIPGQKIGVGLERRKEPSLPSYIAERIAESERIARANGAIIIADPAVALRALTHQRTTFTHQDLARFLHTRTHGADQFNEAFLKVTSAAAAGAGEGGWLDSATVRDAAARDRWLAYRAARGPSTALRVTQPGIETAAPEQDRGADTPEDDLCL